MKNLSSILFLTFIFFSSIFGQKISLIKDINKSPDPSINFFFSSGAFLNSKTFVFIANDGISGPELWSTDGTEGGTKLIKDIYPGINPSGIYGVTKVNNKVVFAADNGVNGTELWVSDGSAVGTFMLKDIDPGSFSSNPNLFVPANGKVYFVYYDFSDTYIWETDGTINGTKSAIEFTKGSDTKISSVFAVNNGFVFEIYDSKTDKQGLYFTDGTKAGTRFIVDVNSVAGYIGRMEINDFAKLANNKYVFASRTSGTSDVPSLFITDLTAAGTMQLATMNYSGSGTISLSPFTVINDKAVFINTNGGKGNQKDELWGTDGTIAGTVILQKGYALDLNSYIDPNLKPLINGKLYFTKDLQFDSGGTFSTDGTIGNTRFEFKFTTDYNYSLIYYSNKLFSLGGTGFTGKIYEINPTTNSSTIFYDENTDSVKCYDFSEPTLINDKIVFAGSFFNGSQFDKEIYRINMITTSTSESEINHLISYKIDYQKELILFQINEPVISELKLFDLNGHNLISSRGNVFSIDKKSYQKGIYFVRIKNNLKEAIIKILIN